MLSMMQDASWAKWGKTKYPNGGNFNLLLQKYYITVFVTIKWCKPHVQPFVLFVICYYLVFTGHCCESMSPGMFWGKSRPKKLATSPAQEFLPRR